MKWSELSMAEKNEVIKMAVAQGIKDISSIKNLYEESVNRSRRFNDGGDTNPAMTGMMKSKLATAAHFGNPTARRMTNYDTRSYTWPNEYEYDRGIGEPKRGNVFVGSYDNLVTPQIQDNGRNLEFVDDVWSPENDQRSYMQSLKFNNEKDARYFGEHYKEIAPMMHLYGDGGPKPVTTGGIHRKIQRGDTLSKIAKEYTGNAMRYNELAKLNNIANPDVIEVGQDIIIPTSFTDTIKNNELPEVVVTGHKREKKKFPAIQAPKIDSTEKANSLYVQQLSNRRKSIEELNAPSFIGSKLQDVKDVISESGSIGDFLQTAYNGVAKHFVDDKQVTTKKRDIKINKQFVPKEVLDEAFAKETRNGTDTLTWDRVPVDKTGNKYYIQESYPITDNMRFGSRNRNEYKDLDSNNAPLTTYKPIHKYEDYIKGINYAGKQYKAVDKDAEGHQNHFMGYDKNGKFKLGPLSKFGPGDTMTQVYYADIIGVPRDANGNIQYVEDRKNPGRFQPVVDVYGESTYDENGNLKRGEKKKSVLTTMSKKRSLDGSYGNVSGGRVLLQVGNETRLVAGSIEHVIQELELMQKNHKGKPVRYYQLDNGSYNRGLRTRNGKNISAQDLKDYDKQNTTSAGGGHFMYIRNKYSNGGSIHIAPSKRGTFTAAATEHGMDVQEFASKVLAHPENYSLTMRKKANFARNSSHWKH